MIVDTRIRNLIGLDWGVLVESLPDSLGIGAVPVRLSLEEARAAAAAAGWRLPSLRETAMAFAGDDAAIWSAQRYDLHVQRYWLRHDYIGPAPNPTGYQINVLSGGLWPHPADAPLSVVMVREAQP